MPEKGDLHTIVSASEMLLIQLRDNVTHSSLGEEVIINNLLSRIGEIFEEIILIGQKEAAHLNWSLLEHEGRNFLVPISNGIYVLRLLDRNEPDVMQVKAVIDRQITQLLEFIANFCDSAC